MRDVHLHLTNTNISTCIFSRAARVLTVKNFDDLLADEVLDFIVIDYSLFKKKKMRREKTFIKADN